MQYNYVVTAHKPSNVNLSVTGRQPALIATFSPFPPAPLPCLILCPTSVHIRLLLPSSLVLPPVPARTPFPLCPHAQVACTPHPLQWWSTCMPHQRADLCHSTEARSPFRPSPRLSASTFPLNALSPAPPQAASLLQRHSLPRSTHCVHGPLHRGHPSGGRDPALAATPVHVHPHPPSTPSPARNRKAPLRAAAPKRPRRLTSSNRRQLHRAERSEPDRGKVQPACHLPPHTRGPATNLGHTNLWSGPSPPHPPPPATTLHPTKPTLLSVCL